MALLKLTNVNLRERDRYGELKHNAFLNSAKRFLRKRFRSFEVTQRLTPHHNQPHKYLELNELLPMGRNSGGEVRKTFLYQKNILFASNKTHSCRNT
ncbi:hypothetical protein [Leptospira noguchii]|uniref:hypothetical protein n=1 Tax=Leptospira noguchii TaxID=28182 RepID=UPI001FB6242C|nr:hypothetical protein [Leptospira noguchii]UOG51872.1 hypothetical protein MAL09_14630 [Leptospira noguchii]